MRDGWAEGHPSSWDPAGARVQHRQAVSSGSRATRPSGQACFQAQETGRGDSSRREARLPEAASPGTSCPCHHHRFGGSSATLLLNKVISSRCTMGTSRMTLVRPSWSRGKMTTFSAGRSAWKLNQRQAVSGALAVQREELPAVGKAAPAWPPGRNGPAGPTHQTPGEAERGHFSGTWGRQPSGDSRGEATRPGRQRAGEQPVGTGHSIPAQQGLLGATQAMRSHASGHLRPRSQDNTLKGWREGTGSQNCVARGHPQGAPTPRSGEAVTARCCWEPRAFIPTHGKWLPTSPPIPPHRGRAAPNVAQKHTVAMEHLQGPAGTAWEGDALTTAQPLR